MSYSTALYTVFQKRCNQTHGGNFVKSQLIFKILFLHWKEKEISSKRVLFPPHLNYVAALPLEIQKFVVKFPNKIKTRMIFVTKKYVLWNMGICPIASKVGHVTLATPPLGSFIVPYVVLDMAYPTKKKRRV